MMLVLHDHVALNTEREREREYIIEKVIRDVCVCVLRSTLSALLFIFMLALLLRIKEHREDRVRSERLFCP